MMAITIADQFPEFRANCHSVKLKMQYDHGLFARIHYNNLLSKYTVFPGYT